MPVCVCVCVNMCTMVTQGATFLWNIRCHMGTKSRDWIDRFPSVLAVRYPRTNAVGNAVRVSAFFPSASTMSVFGDVLMLVTRQVLLHVYRCTINPVHLSS